VKLKRLITTLPSATVTGFGGEGPDVTSLHYRSQDVQTGGVFVAIRGLSADGHDFIDDALGRGAAAVVAERPVATPKPVIRVRNSRRALAELAATFYGHPSEQMVVIAVTGTNGKTTTAYLIEGILEQAGLRTGVIGTINYRFAGASFANPVTTPESLDLQRILADMRSAGVTHVVLEASSHAIDLYRIHRCWMDVAVFTNLSQDHLDYHGSMQAYWDTKKRVFTEYLPEGPKAGRAAGVINTDSRHGRELVSQLDYPVITTGTGQGCRVRGEHFSCDLKGIHGALVLENTRVAVHSRLVGHHNIENILCAAGAGQALGIGPQAIRDGIEAVTCVPGRLESVENATGRFVYVDYSHTPDALENALTALRALTAGRIICVFGCGGDRDRSKRPRMGAIAARLSNLAVVTSDNPRSENPLTIIEDILPGLRQAGAVAADDRGLRETENHRLFIAEPNRRRAIELGIQAAHPGDTVLIAGKGHETYQVIGHRRIHFDDREEARRVLETLEAEGMGHGA
jgi:UDP-N-acetylmuramoyl-L-alanyl-D-glutamate--2,6-diaminopimelate ligase/murE/murF fusion protein